MLTDPNYCPQTTLRAKQDAVLYYIDSNAPKSQALGLSGTTPSAVHWSANYFTIAPLTSDPGVTYTTTYAYDQNGNLTQSYLTDTNSAATTTTYVYDYANHLTALGINGATTTYRYDAGGSRVFQGNDLTTTIYPNKLYSIISSMSGTTTTATSTEYAYVGSTLLATIDQSLINGTAAGTPLIRYNHPDILGSTNVTSDANGTLAQSFNYAPYGSVLSSTNTGTTTATRQYIGEVYDEGTGLNYLNARYLQSSRGQFLSIDPVFWEIGKTKDGKAALANPMAQNSYSYAEGNPITKKDPEGREAYGVGITIGAEGGLGAFAGFTFSAGVSYIHNPDTGQRWFAAPITFGSTAGIFGSSVSYPKSDISPTVMGAYAGGGFNVNYSPNTKTPNDIRGIQTSLNFNIPAASVSIQGGQTNSPTISGGLGVKGVGSGSMYSVQTWAPAVSFSAIKSVTSTMVSSLQTAITQLQQKTNTTSNQGNKKP